MFRHTSYRRLKNKGHPVVKNNRQDVGGDISVYDYRKSSRYTVENYRRYEGGSHIDHPYMRTVINEIVPDISKVKIQARVNGEIDEDMEYILNSRPNGHQSGYDFKRLFIEEAIMYGNSFIEVVREGGTIRLERLMRDRVKIVTYTDDEESRIKGHYYVLLEKDKFHIDNKGNKADGRKLEPESVINIKFYPRMDETGVLSDGLLGWSLPELLMRDFDLGEITDNLINYIAQKGGRGAGTFKVDNDGLEIDSVHRREIRKMFEEGNWWFSPVILDETQEFTPNTGFESIIKMVLDSREVIPKISSLTGIPKYKFGGESTNMSVKDLNENFERKKLPVYLDAIVNEFSFKLYSLRNKRDGEFYYNSDALRVLDFETIKEKAQLIRGTYAGTTDEVREVIGLEPIGNESSDKILAPLNHVDLETLVEGTAEPVDNTE